MENGINNADTYENIYHAELKDFWEETCPAYSDDVSLLIEEIKMTEIKSTNTKIPKFTLQIYAFVYDIIMEFPTCTFIFYKLQRKPFSKMFID